MTTVIVIGAGVVGSSLTYHLSRAGASVTTIDAGRPGGGTSLATLAWVNASTRRPEHYFRLSQRAMAEHRALERELGGDWIEGTGCLEWGADATEQRELHARIELLQGWGYAAERVPTARLASLEPSLRLDPAQAPWVGWFPDDQYVQVNRLIAAQLADARERRADVRAGAEVVGFLRDGQQVVGVTLADGTELRADHVVDAAGHRADRLAAMLGWDLPMHPEPGLILVTEPAPTVLRGVIRAPGLELRHDGGGRILLSALFAEHELTLDGPPPLEGAACREALARARTLVAGLEGVELETARLGVRPMPDDGRPLVGPFPGAPGAYVVATHSGVSLGPLLGRLVAAELLGDGPVPALEHYRPDRIVDHG
jgi:glycine/D-amino acid oxidase-like deaminating enzyme